MKKLILILLTSSFAFASPQKPTRLLFMVFDQMRPDYIDRFDLKNFKRLRAMGTNYKNAYVGHLGSLTVVSHAVMTTGLMPKNLPWFDNSLWDKKGRLGEAGQVYNTLTLSQEQYLKLLKTVPAGNFLIKSLKEQTAKKVFTVGEKDYAALALGGPYSDVLIYAQKASGSCVPFGVNVPERIVKNDRFRIDCAKSYGTDSSLYPLDGNRFYPGDDKAHLGGDIWVTDLALDLMRNEKDWSALFLTFGAIDKFGHMLGETDGETPHAFGTPAHLKDIALIADAQLGRLLKELEDQKILGETLILSTADHGGQTDEIYLGNPGAGEPFWIQRVGKMAPLRFSVSDTAIRFWLKDPTPENKEKTLQALKEISQVTEVFSLQKDSYKLEFERLKTQPKKFQDWAKAHDLELVNTMAGETAPDLVASLADNVGFGKLGDHGGMQEKVQRIPMLMAGPGIPKKTDSSGKRLMDLAGLIKRSFGIQP